MVPVRYRPTGRTAADLAADVEQAVRDSALVAGDLLPPVRTLAADLQVAPGTVAAAYRRLRERGLVLSDGRRGTRVRPRPAVAARSEAPVGAPPGVVDLSTGLPDLALLPPLGPALHRLAAGAGPAAAPDVPVLPALQRLARAGFDADGVPAGGLVVTSGALDAVERVLRAHLRPGDAVAVEDPGWPSLLDLVASLGLRTRPLPLDDEGPLPDALAAALTAGARAVVVTSRAQNPTGAAVTAVRRDRLRAVLAGAPQTLVLEDDHAADLADVPLAVVAGTTEAWAFVRSLSKPYGPDLRLAVCAADPTTASRVEGGQRLGAGWVSTLLQRLAVELAGDPEVRAAVRGASAAYAARRTALVAALAGRGVAASGRTGLNVWVPVRDETEAVARLLAAGWLAAPGARARLASPPGVRLSIGGLPLADVDRLAGATAQAVAGARPRAYTA